MSAFPGVLSLALLFSPLHTLCAFFGQPCLLSEFLSHLKTSDLHLQLDLFLELQTDVICRMGSTSLAFQRSPGGCCTAHLQGAPGTGSPQFNTSISVRRLAGVHSRKLNSTCLKHKEMHWLTEEDRLSFWVAWSSGPISSFKVRGFLLIILFS